MSLEHAILGLLNYEPMTGYELKKLIDLSISHFWPAVQSQIYKTLSRMETDEWLTVETIPQESRPPRKVYTITPKGRTELFDWLEKPIPPAETRVAWLVQIFFAGQMEDSKIIYLLRHLLGIQQQRLNAFTNIPKENRETMQNDAVRDRFFWMLTVDYGVAQTISQIQWLEKVIRAVENHDYRLPTLEANAN
ncbi:MAG: PadR family transcriptional regulator [Chloroflexi bacterium HGW-Chloroflexi-10]|nr:MAG: PadR family transcriptional regulator [Chloroflexi bacterium HGW-Chloroflexi-10]